MAEKEVKEEKKEVTKYTLGSVITGTEPAILIGEQPVTTQQALVILLNEIEEIKKALL